MSGEELGHAERQQPLVCCPTRRGLPIQPCGTSLRFGRSCAESVSPSDRANEARHDLSRCRALPICEVCESPRKSVSELLRELPRTHLLTWASHSGAGDWGHSNSSQGGARPGRADRGIVSRHRGPGIAYQPYIGRRAVSAVAFDLSTQPGTAVASSAGTGG
jgi:hypothetical protein